MDLQFDPKDIKIDRFRSEITPVRVTHFPTGIIVVCERYEKYEDNRFEAMRMLRRELLRRQGTTEVQPPSEI
jgi:protein subunit release factor A